LQKPVSSLNATRCFSAAIGYMVRERRRYFRHPVDIPVTIFFGERQEIKATATNISDGGMAIRFRSKLPKGNVSKISFKLPTLVSALECKAQFAWIDGTGRAGLRFADMAKSSREQLDGWLAEEFEKSEAKST
jgi:c-di-GMP-binding flagellar brake protein YcgR